MAPVKVEKVGLSDILRTRRALTAAALHYARRFQAFSDGARAVTEIDVATAEAALETAALAYGQAKMSRSPEEPDQLASLELQVANLWADVKALKAAARGGK